MAARTIDARGMRCPWPALRLARAMREGADELVLLADDPAAEGEVRALAGAQGWAVTDVAEGWRVNRLFTKAG